MQWKEHWLCSQQRGWAPSSHLHRVTSLNFGVLEKKENVTCGILPVLEGLEQSDAQKDPVFSYY